MLPTNSYRKTGNPGNSKLRFLLMRLLGVIICILSLYFLYTKVFEDEVKYRRRKFIVVLGGGVAPGGGLPTWVEKRACKAEKLFNEANKLPTIVTLSRGTPHKPNPLDKDGFPIYESTATAKYLLEMGVPAEKIVEESYSLDTVGNAYFLRTMHLEPSSIRKLIIVTNKWHMPRTKAIFEKVFSLPFQSYSLTGIMIRTIRTFCFFLGPTWPYHLHFEEAPDGMTGDMLIKRREREGISLGQFVKETSHKFHDMESLHTFMFQKHSAYASFRLEKATSQKLDPEVMKTYR